MRPRRFRRQRTRNLRAGPRGGGHANDGLTDTVYVIASGYGALRWGDTALECTAGDVLFVPNGRPHCFERLHGEIRIWRISAVPGPAIAGPQN